MDLTFVWSEVTDGSNTQQHPKEVTEIGFPLVGRACLNFFQSSGKARWHVDGMIIVDAETAAVDQCPDCFWTLIFLNPEVHCQKSGCSCRHIDLFGLDLFCRAFCGPQLERPLLKSCVKIRKGKNKDNRLTD